MNILQNYYYQKFILNHINYFIFNTNCLSLKKAHIIHKVEKFSFLNFNRIKFCNFVHQILFFK